MGDIPVYRKRRPVVSPKIIIIIIIIILIIIIIIIIIENNDNFINQFLKMHYNMSKKCVKISVLLQNIIMIIIF